MKESKEYKTGMKNNENFKYVNPGKKQIKDEDDKIIGYTEQFPIVASEIIYQYNSTVAIGTSNLMEMHKAEFNVCMVSAVSYRVITPTLKNALEADVTLMTNNIEFYNPNNGILKILKDGDVYLTEQMAGVRFSNQPGYMNLINEDFRHNYMYLMEEQESEEKLKLLVYINMSGSPHRSLFVGMPGYETKDPEALYEEFLDIYQDIYKPQVFSYDFSPIHEKADLLFAGIQNDISGKNEGTVLIDSERFYDDLVTFSQLSETHDRPFWAYCQGWSYINFSGTNKVYQPIALENYLRYEAFSAIGYGAKGIVYRTYATRATENNESYLSALLDRKGRRTASWKYAQRINKEIQKYNHIFLGNSKVLRVKDIEENDVIFRVDPLSKYPLYSVQIFTDRKNGIFVSEIASDSGFFLMVVSKSPLLYQKLTFKHTGFDMIEKTPYSSKIKEERMLEKGEDTRILIPGGYRIFEIREF